VEFGIVYNTGYLGTDPARLVAVAQHAEDCGFESFYVPEHIVLYPGATLGPYEIPPSLPIIDPLDCLSFVAAATSKILLGTAVLLLPYHHPVVLAKRLATIDVLSGGRMRRLTIGVGSLSGEAAAVGVDFASRGRRADEAMDVLRLLWAGDDSGVSYTGEFYSFTDICCFPKPHQTSTLPIHVGGSSRAAARRAGSRGDGFFPGGALTPAQRTEQLALARELSAARGCQLEYTRWGSLEMGVADVAGYAEQGVSRLVVSASATNLDEQRREIDDFAARHHLS
jgi:probable F420-dependent oxidoreductase